MCWLTLSISVWGASCRTLEPAWPPLPPSPCACVRSFAIVIQQLPNPLRDAVCVFYLVLRGLDTVEDDMALADEIKLPALYAFHKSIYQKCASVPQDEQQQQQR